VSEADTTHNQQGSRRMQKERGRYSATRAYDRIEMCLRGQKIEERGIVKLTIVEARSFKVKEPMWNGKWRYLRSERIGRGGKLVGGQTRSAIEETPRKRGM